jgi:hypothetical protein
MTTSAALVVVFFARGHKLKKRVDVHLLAIDAHVVFWSNASTVTFQQCLLQQHFNNIFCRIGLSNVLCNTASTSTSTTLFSLCFDFVATLHCDVVAVLSCYVATALGFGGREDEWAYHFAHSLIIALRFFFINLFHFFHLVISF